MAKKKTTKKLIQRKPVSDYDWESTGVSDKVSEALGRRWGLGDIRRIIAIDAGQFLGTEPQRVSRPLEQKILKAARDDLSERLNLDRQYEKSLAIEFYESVIRSETVEVRDQIRAQERIDAILGLDSKYDSGKDTAEQIAERVRKALEALTDIHEG